MGLDNIRVSIIIPVLHLRRPKNKRFFYAKRFTIKELLADIQANVSINREVIVICNSRDPKLLEFVTTHPAIDKFCLNSANVGVARSWNMGAQMAEGEALCFINDDVHVGPDALEKLFDVLYNESKAGMVGPKGAKWKGAVHERYVGIDSMEEADAISGFLFMLRSDLFREIGGFDVGFTPAGFEEIDMGRMVQQASYRCLVVPHLDVHHFHEHGVSSANVEIQYFKRSICAKHLHERNRRYFLDKWGITDAE